MTTGGPAGPNMLAPGPNSATVTPVGASQPFTFAIDLPANGLQWTSQQLYFYFSSLGSAGWSVLNGGNFVIGNMVSG